MKIKYARLYNDDAGESHFEDLEEELTLTNFAPPAQPLYVSTLNPATQTGLLGAPSGWFGDWHPSSARNLFFVLSGEWEIQASDGEVRRFGPGQILRVEDTTGKGHMSRVISDTESLAGLVELAGLAS
jgi:hypothetical protein